MRQSVPYNELTEPLAMATQPSLAMTTLSKTLRRAGLAVLFLLVVFLFVSPVAMLVAGIFHEGSPGGSASWSVGALTRTFADSRTYLAIGNSALYAASTTAIGTTLGTVFAFLATRTTVPLGPLLAPTMLLVFAAPNLLYAISWSLLADPSAGLLNEAAGAVLGAATHPFNAYSWPSLVMVQGLKLAAFCFLLLVGPFRNMNRSFEEASLVAGATRLQTLIRVDVPIMAPAIFGTVIIGLVFGLSAFDIPQILGSLGDIPVLSTEIYRAINFAIPPDYARASSLGLVMIVVLGVLMAIQWRALKTGRFVTVTGKSARQDRWSLGRWNALGAAAILVYVLITLVLPGVQLALTSFEPTIGVYQFTLDNYRAILSEPQTAEAFRTTALLAVLGGLLAVSFATLLGQVGRRTSPALDRLFDAATLMPLAMPGVVLAVGMLWLYISVPGLRSLYATVWLTLIGLVVFVMPVASRAVRGGLAQIAEELEEAASVSGASDLRVLLDIVLQLISRSFLSGWLLAGIIAAGTLDIPLMLLPATRPNIAVLAFTQISAAMPTQASALLMLLIAAIVGMTLIYGAAALSVRAIRISRRSES
jgi:iron(III) transport system permease protein